MRGDLESLFIIREAYLFEEKVEASDCSKMRF